MIASAPIRPRTRREGFTLLELMVIVVIVLALTAMIAPSAVRAFANYQAQAAALHVLRAARIARREAMESGRAIVVRSTGSGASTHLEVRRGDTNLCRTSDWATLFATSCAIADDVDNPATGCLGYVDPAMFGVGTHEVLITALDTQDICYQPNGEAMVAPAGGTVFSRPAAGSAIRYEIRRQENGEDVLPVRTIIMPFDAAPRSIL